MRLTEARHHHLSLASWPSSARQTSTSNFPRPLLSLQVPGAQGCPRHPRSICALHVCTVNVGPAPAAACIGQPRSRLTWGVAGPGLGCNDRASIVPGTPSPYLSIPYLPPLGDHSAGL